MNLRQQARWHQQHDPVCMRHARLVEQAEIVHFSLPSEDRLKVV